MLNTLDKLPVDIKLMICQMALKSIPTSTIDFFSNLYRTIPDYEKPYSRTEMANKNNMSSLAAKLHVDRLVDGGFLTRKHYRSWVLNMNSVVDPLLLSCRRL